MDVTEVKVNVLLVQDEVVVDQFFDFEEQIVYRATTEI